MSAMRRYYANTDLDIDEMGAEIFLHDQYRLEQECSNERFNFGMSEPSPQLSFATLTLAMLPGSKVTCYRPLS